MNPTAEIGVIGGSGFYAFLDDTRQFPVSTPYGAPSAPVTIGMVGDRSVAFLPRHGLAHEYPPHRVNTGPTCGPCTTSASSASSRPAPWDRSSRGSHRAIL